MVKAHTTRFNGDCYTYGLLASGHIDLIVECRLEPFDYCALVPVVEGAGGVISDWDGKPLGLGSVLTRAENQSLRSPAHRRNHVCAE